jgi:hypothetical protein
VDVEEFITRWTAREGGAERANYQMFLSELCDFPGLSPVQAERDVRRDRALSEAGRTVRDGEQQSGMRFSRGAVLPQIWIRSVCHGPVPRRARRIWVRSSDGIDKGFGYNAIGDGSTKSRHPIEGMKRLAHSTRDHSCSMQPVRSGQRPH